MIIVFEGIDRSGKSTQCKMLSEHLNSNGVPAVLLRYPNRGSPQTGPVINKYLARELELEPGAASLLLAANLWELKDQIQLEQQKGNIILVDRYIWSNIAYSKARGFSMDVFKRLSDGLPIPDVTFFMDAPPEIVSARGGYGDERFDKIDFQCKVSSIMKNLALDDERCITINANRDKEDISREIIQAVTKLT